MCGKLIREIGHLKAVQSECAKDIVILDAGMNALVTAWSILDIIFYKYDISGKPEEYRKYFIQKYKDLYPKIRDFGILHDAANLYKHAEISNPKYSEYNNKFYFTITVSYDLQGMESKKLDLLTSLFAEDLLENFEYCLKLELQELQNAR